MAFAQPDPETVHDVPAHDALGYRFTPAVTDPMLKAHLRVLFGGLPRADHIGADRLGVDDHDLLTDQLLALMSRINVAAIDAAAGNLLLHAGAVAQPDGSAAILCGRSGSGKTTLTIRLAETGLAYLTDEAVCLEPQTLRLTPFRKPATVKLGAQQLLAHLRPCFAGATEGTWLVPPSAFEKVPPPPRPLSPTLVIFPAYRQGAECEVERLSEAETGYLLGVNSSRLGKVRSGPLEALSRLARRARAYRMVHGDAGSAARLVHDLMAA